MTPEQTLEKHGRDISGPALSAMDEYAKQKAIEFMKWALENDKISGDNYGFAFIHHPETAETVFDQFIKSGNK